jgi:hypothetical protein
LFAFIRRWRVNRAKRELTEMLHEDGASEKIIEGVLHWYFYGEAL